MKMNLFPGLEGLDNDTMQGSWSCHPCPVVQEPREEPRDLQPGRLTQWGPGNSILQQLCRSGPHPGASPLLRSASMRSQRKIQQ